MAVFYFKSPDYTLSGNIKVELTELPSKRYSRLSDRYIDDTEICFALDSILDIDVVEIRINDGDPIILEGDPECDGGIPFHTVNHGKDWEVLLAISNPFTMHLKCELVECTEVLQYDRVMYTDFKTVQFEDLSFAEWKEAQDEYAEHIKSMFKADLVSLLNRYNNKRINRKGSLTERIQRIYKRYYGHTVPAFKISDLGVKS